MQRLGFCLGFGFGALDQYRCGVLDSLLGFDLVPLINTGAARWILSWVSIWHPRLILVRCLGFCLVFWSGILDQYWHSTAPWIWSRVSACRLGFCLVFQFGTLDQYWCATSDSVLSSGLAPQSDTGAAPWILSCVPVQHLGSILEHNLPHQP